MAFPYMIGPGGQPYVIQQVPIMQQAVPLMQATPQMPPQAQPPPQPVQQKLPDYMSEERLQEKGTIKL